MSNRGMSFDDVFAHLSEDEEFRRESRKLKPKFDLLLAIIKKRKELSLTQAELAQRANTHQSRISLIESGEYDVRLSTIIQIAEALDCELEIKLNPITKNENAAQPMKSFVIDFQNRLIFDVALSQDYQESTEAGSYNYGPVETKIAV